MNKKVNKKKFGGAKELIISISALFVVAIVAIAIVLSSIGGKSDEQTFLEEILTLQSRHPLTGEILLEDLKSLPQVFGVMIENNYEAWPLSGLDGAFLVIEAPVEANIPRFIAFFSEEATTEKIGPGRSARTYYLDWNDALNAVYAHVGGSPEALNLIAKEYKTIDLNQFWQSEYFWRENGTRYAPHNVFTSSELLVSALEKLDLGEPKYDVWKFTDDAPVEKPVSISVDFADGSVYDLSWEYQTQTNSYLRYQGSSVMKMEDGAKISANNVVVISTDMRVIDNEGRLSLLTVGAGDALIIQNGEMYLARWQKNERDERIKFYTADGYEISFNAGVTWIEVVSSLSQVSEIE